MNPYHDRKNGEFTTAGAGKGSSRAKVGGATAAATGDAMRARFEQRLRETIRQRDEAVATHNKLNPNRLRNSRTIHLEK